MTRSRSIGAAYIYTSQVASEQLIADCPSLSLRSGDLLCVVNCLKAVQNHRSEIASEHAGPSGLSQEWAQPSIFTPYSSTQDSNSTSDIDSAGSKQNAFLTRFTHSQNYVAKMSRRLFEAVEENIQLATQLGLEVFGVTIYMARLAKRIIQDKGVMSSPNSKAGKPLSEVTSLTMSSDSGFQ